MNFEFPSFPTHLTQHLVIPRRHDSENPVKAPLHVGQCELKSSLLSASLAIMTLGLSKCNSVTLARPNDHFLLLPLLITRETGRERIIRRRMHHRDQSNQGKSERTVAEAVRFPENCGTRICKRRGQGLSGRASRVPRTLSPLAGSPKLRKWMLLDEQAIEKHLQSVIDRTEHLDISFNAIAIPDAKILGVPPGAGRQGISHPKSVRRTCTSWN